MSRVEYLQNAFEEQNSPNYKYYYYKTTVA